MTEERIGHIAKALRLLVVVLASLLFVILVVEAGAENGWTTSEVGAMFTLGAVLGAAATTSFYRDLDKKWAHLSVRMDNLRAEIDAEIERAALLEKDRG